MLNSNNGLVEWWNDIYKGDYSDPFNKLNLGTRGSTAKSNKALKGMYDLIDTKIRGDKSISVELIPGQNSALDLKYIKSEKVDSGILSTFIMNRKSKGGGTNRFEVYGLKASEELQKKISSVKITVKDQSGRAVVTKLPIFADSKGYYNYVTPVKSAIGYDTTFEVLFSDNTVIDYKKDFLAGVYSIDLIDKEPWASVSTGFKGLNMKDTAKLINQEIYKFNKENLIKSIRENPNLKESDIRSFEQELKKIEEIDVVENPYFLRDIDNIRIKYKDI